MITVKDKARWQFRKLVFDGGRLVGAIFINVQMNPDVIMELIEKQIDAGEPQT